MQTALRTALGGLALAALLPFAAPASAADYSASLAASPSRHSGACPYKFTFHGVIRANRAGRVQYKFIRSDGANAPVRTINFDKPGVRKVSTTWTLGGPGMEYDGWQAIQIVYPQQVTSRRAAFSLRCAGRGGGPRPPVRRMPDLIVKDMSVTGQCKIRLTIANVGSGGVPESAYDPKNGATIQMYQGADPFGGIRLVGIDPEKKLKTPGAEVTWVWFPGARNLTVPRAPREYRAVVDNNNAVRESDERNNSLTETLACRSRPAGPGRRTTPQGGKRPDLGMYGFLRIGKQKKLVKWNETIVLTPADATLISNGKPAFDIFYSYREFADGAAPGPFRNKVFFNGQLVSQQTNLSLGPKEIKAVHTQAYIGPQNGQLSIRIDADNNVTESREDNNGPFTVTVRFRGF